MPRVHRVKKARKEHTDTSTGEKIQKGESYYWWEFRYAGVRKSKAFPTAAQLTTSPFLQEVYRINEMISGIEDPHDLNAMISDVQVLLDETQESLEAMPEALQDTSSSGELLRDRIEELETLVDELETLDSEVDDLEAEEDEEDWIERVGTYQYEGS